MLDNCGFGVTSSCLCKKAEGVVRGYVGLIALPKGLRMEKSATVRF